MIQETPGPSVVQGTQDPPQPFNFALRHMLPSSLETPQPYGLCSTQPGLPWSSVARCPTFKHTPDSGTTSLLAGPSGLTFISAHTFTHRPALTPKLHHGHMGPLTCLTPITALRPPYTHICTYPKQKLERHLLPPQSCSSPIHFNPSLSLIFIHLLNSTFHTSLSPSSKALS